MAQRKKDKDEEERVIDAGRAESPIDPPDPEVQQEFEEAHQRARSGAQLLRRKFKEHASGPLLSGGDIDADWEDAEFVGEEAVAGGNPTPDQSVVDDIGEAVGDEQEDGKPIRMAVEKYRPGHPEDLPEESPEED
jgi:hypothetical protein